MGVTIAAWALYAAFIVLRPAGRMGAYFALTGFALVILARVVLAGSHF